MMSNINKGDWVVYTGTLFQEQFRDALVGIHLIDDKEGYNRSCFSNVETGDEWLVKVEENAPETLTTGDIVYYVGAQEKFVHLYGKPLKFKKVSSVDRGEGALLVCEDLNGKSYGLYKGSLRKEYEEKEVEAVEKHDSELKKGDWVVYTGVGGFKNDHINRDGALHRIEDKQGKRSFFKGFEMTDNNLQKVHKDAPETLTTGDKVYYVGKDLVDLYGKELEYRYSSTRDSTVSVKDKEGGRYWVSRKNLRKKYKDSDDKFSKGETVYYAGGILEHIQDKPLKYIEKFKSNGYELCWVEDEHGGRFNLKEERLISEYDYGNIAHEEDKKGEEEMAQPKPQYLMKQAFDNWNSLKRYQALEEIAREKGDAEEVRKMELLKYKAMGRTELSLRAIQSEIFKLTEE